MQNNLPLRCGHLFAGIGGFDLAAEWMGWENVFHCENNPFCKRILNYYWPNAISYDDITKTDFSIHRGQIDLLTGGFPCQPYSTAGKRKGTEDERHLWPEMLRAIREIKPRWIVGENVAGLISWNRGLVFNEVQTDLEAEGYQVQPVLLPACAVNAPHRRDRVWFISRLIPNSSNNGPFRNKESEKRCCGESEGISLDESNPLHGRGVAANSRSCNGRGLCGHETHLRREEKKQPIDSNVSGGRNASNPECQRQPQQGQPERSLHTETDKEWKASWSYNDGRWPTQSPICSRNDGLSGELDFDAVWEGINPRKPLITFAKWRQESIKGYGNAVVPQLVHEFFKVIEKMELNHA